MEWMTPTDFKIIIHTLKRYNQTFHKRLPNIFQPKTFNEYLLRKKIFDRNPLLTQLADKYAVREYVAERIGTEYLAKLYYVTDDPATIDFAQLPNRFVIKATHGSGYNLIVKDKSSLDYNEVIQTCRKWLSSNYYKRGGEWCYRDIPPRIIIEEFLKTDNGDVPPDYKFFCFNGQPHFVQVDVDRFIEHKRNIYDLEWNKLPVAYHFKNFDWALDAPINLGKMISLAQKLSNGLDFIRVDLYSLETQVIVGEMTNYPENGFGNFDPPEYDLVFGEKWQ